MTIGTWYYPKNWPRSEWADDIETIASAGFEHVRMGVFYWSRVEPRRGEFDFEWLATALDLFETHNIDVVLGTPTGAPPKWLVDENPDILQQDPDGTVREWGSRRHYCFNSPTYRQETERIVRRVTERFADHSAVIGWQLDNEFGCHDTTRCYCDDCAGAFREWLAERYGDVESLNEAWGTDFWSQHHDSFAEVDPPGPTPTRHHPSRLLDFYRFSSDSVVDYARLQADLVREVDPEWTVLTNFMGDFSDLDAYAVGDLLDLVTWNSYPTLYAQRTADDLDDGAAETLRTGDPEQIALNHDLYRSVLDQPFWIMEQQSGDTVAFPYSPEPADGMMRLWAHHAHAHGADNVNFFRWRRCREGQEQYWGGLRRHDGSPDRGFREADQAADELAGLNDLATPTAQVALLHDYDSCWAIEAYPHAADFDYWAHLRTYYRALRRRGVQVDVVSPDSDLDGYAAVVAPTLYVLPPDLGDHLATYVEGGGELLATIRTGVADASNQLFDDLFPGPLSDIMGAEVGQHESLPPALETSVNYHDETYDYRTWGEWLLPDDATVLGEHASGPAAGEPAITYNDVGDGSDGTSDRSGGATYVGVWPGDDLANALVDDLLDRAGVETISSLPERVHVTERDGYTWVTNFRSTPVSVDAPTDATWIHGGSWVEAHDLAVVRADRRDLRVDIGE